ncbi:hypothetical protein BaRGS_00035464, partial [Batillaria attramentaria]
GNRIFAFLFRVAGAITLTKPDTEIPPVSPALCDVMWATLEGAGLLLLMAVVTSHAATCAVEQRPNIVYVNMDDLGYGDVDWHDSTMVTPNIRKVGEDGRTMEYYYTLQSCSPSRSALLSGRYPFRYGLPKNVIESANLVWLPLDLKLLPQELQDLDYKTHMIGKWHLGHCDWDLTPINRGFSTFYGKIKGNSDYFTHNAQFKYLRDFYDFFDGTRNATEAEGHYSTTLFSDRAVKIIDEHTGPRPFFIYLAYQSNHVPFQVPDHYVTNTNCSQIPDDNRQVYCGMLAAADEGIGNITEALKRNGLYDNTVFIVTSDNGAAPLGGYSQRSASNFPLRGGKVTLWEGGTRVWAVIRAPGMVNPGTTWNSLFHVVDWKPTLVQAACGEPQINSGDDGIAMYNDLLNDQPGPRTTLIYNVYKKDHYSAVRGPRFKLMWGYSKKSPGWYFPKNIQAEVEDVSLEELQHLSGYHLYDLIADPTERNNVYSLYENEPEVQELKTLLQEANAQAVPWLNGEDGPLATPLRSQAHYCIPGWCEVDGPPSVCSPTPCQNGGTCIMEDSTRGYYCMCPRRASGDDCETLAPCKESEMQDGSYLQNAQSEVRADGFYITAVDPSTQFKADFVTSGDKKADFESVTFEVQDGDVKRMQFNVYDEKKAVEDGVSAITLRVLHVGHCLQHECSDGWQGYGDSCYKLFPAANYITSVSTCEEQNGVLASARTEDEFNFIYQTVAESSPLWLGGDDQAAEGTWVWRDGTLISNGYDNWKSGEPDGNHNTKDADCVWVLRGGLWRDGVCSWPKPFVCRVAECAASWSKYEGACYQFFNTPTKYNDAVTACSSEGAVLSPAKTEGEFQFLFNTVAAGSLMWLGGDDQAVENSWVWRDGTAVNNGYANWKSGEPDGVHNTNTNADCLLVTSSGLWRDAPCTWSRPYVCKYVLGA